MGWRLRCLEVDTFVGTYVYNGNNYVIQKWILFLFRNEHMQILHVLAICSLELNLETPISVKEHTLNTRSVLLCGELNVRVCI